MIYYSLNEIQNDALTVLIYVRDSDKFLYFDEYERSNIMTPWQKFGRVMHLKEQLWFTKEPYQIFEELGIKVDKKRSYELESLFDGNITGYYYLEAASYGTEDAAKWLLSLIAAHLNENRIPFSKINQVFPADYLKEFILSLKDGRLDRTFAKEVCLELLSKGEQFINNARKNAKDVLLEIIFNPKYKTTSADEIDSIIDNIISSNYDNVNKVKDQPKLMQWFIGQVMKASKGKAPASVVQEKLREKLGIT